VISVLVVNHDGKAWLERCLASLGEPPPPDVEVVLVDNASADDSLAAARRRFPSLRVLRMGHNVGFAVANNLAAACARGEELLLLNNDAWLEPGALNEMRRVLEADDELALVAPRLVGTDGRPRFSWAPDRSLAGEALQRLRNPFEGAALNHGPVERLLKAVLGPGWYTAACLLVRRRAFEDVAGFDPAFFLYFEDADLCRRLRGRGWRLGHAPGATVVHAGGGRRLDAATALHYRRSQLYYYSEHRPRLPPGSRSAGAAGPLASRRPDGPPATADGGARVGGLRPRGDLGGTAGGHPGSAAGGSRYGVARGEPMTEECRLRVGIEVGKAAGIADGIGRYARCLLAELLELEDGPDLLLFDLSDDRLSDPELPGLLTGAPPAPEGALDVFHSTGPALPPPGPTPLVATVHDLTMLTHAEHHTAVNRARATAGLVEAVARGAIVIAVSHHTREELVELVAVPVERVVVVHEAPDPVFRPATVDEAVAAAARRPGLEGPYVLAVGSLEPRKNLTGLLDALLLLDRSPAEELTLAVVGPGGWHNQTSRERLAAAGRRLHIVELGYVSDRELLDLYRGATLFAYPSLSEGFGLPVLEAMACGTPVITSDRGSLPEVAGDAAELVDPEDAEALAAAIARVLGDEAWRRELVRRGLANAARFSWQRTARETVAVYERAAREGGR